MAEEEQFGEDALGHPEEYKTAPAVIFYQTEAIIKDKKLTFEEASKCLGTLGKDESGIRYAYLMLSATDRKLTEISTVLNFNHVLFLDVSGNYLTLDNLQVVSKMPFLVLLKAERNRVESGALETMPYLQVLDFNRNQIRETNDINQPLLDCLELNYNLIYIIQFESERLENLKQLELRGNHLLDISGSYPVSIEKLYIADNKIKKIDPYDFSKLINLKILHLRDNLLRKLNGFSAELVNLNYLNVRNNKITKLRQFRKLQCLPNLEILIINGNPVCGDELGEKGEDRGEKQEEEEFGEDGPQIKADPNRIGLLVLLPNLKRINKELVTLEEREIALEVKEEKLREILEEYSSDEETEVPTTTDFTTDFTTSDSGGETNAEEEDESEEDIEEN